jgi:hypothetical protein
MYNTNFVETNALLAALDGDRAEVQRILSEMNGTEIRAFADGCSICLREMQRENERRRAADAEAVAND